MKIAVFYNAKTNPQNKRYALETAAILERYKLKYCLNPAQTLNQKIDLALAVGGDGTVLYAANLLADQKIPILGINFGHRGYLSEIGKDEIEAGIRRIIAGKYKIQESTRIRAEITKRKDRAYFLEALNEISVGGINRTVHIEADLITPQTRLKTEISGDGLIISTRTGSTAYNINAGGPMLLTEAFSIVANNAFFQSDVFVPGTKSMVVPSETVIEIKNLSANAANLPFVIADGQKSLKLGKYDLISIKKAEDMNYFIKF